MVSLSELEDYAEEIQDLYLLSLVTDLRREITTKRDKEEALLRKGHLSECSQEIARVLILRYGDILGLNSPMEIYPLIPKQPFTTEEEYRGDTW